MKMICINIINILLRAVPGPPHITDHVSRPPVLPHSRIRPLLQVFPPAPSYHVPDGCVYTHSFVTPKIIIFRIRKSLRDWLKCFQTIPGDPLDILSIIYFHMIALFFRHLIFPCHPIQYSLIARFCGLSVLGKI